MSSISREDFISAISRLAGSVYDFHSRFDIPNVNGSSDQALSRLRTRLAFLAEEVGEHAKELNRGELDDAAIELADVAFVALGSLLELDSLGADSCREVAAKNDGKTTETHMLEAGSGKLVKRSSRL